MKKKLILVPLLITLWLCILNVYPVTVKALLEPSEQLKEEDYANFKEEIVMGNTYTGSFAGADSITTYRFKLDSSGRVNIKTLQDEQFEYYIYDYKYRSEDAYKGQMWCSDRDDMDVKVENNNYSGSVCLTKGTYLLVVENVNHCTGDYPFELTFENANVSFEEEGIDIFGGSDDDSSHANDIDFNTDYNGQTAMNDGCDFYKFVLSGTGAITLQAAADHETNYMIYDETNPDAWNSSETEALFNVQDKDFKSEEIYLAKGTYYLIVREGEVNIDESDAYPYPPQRKDCKGNYSFKLDFKRSDVSFDKNGYSMDTANEIELGKTYTGQMSQGESKNYYKFTLDLPQSYIGCAVTAEMEVFFADFVDSDSEEYDRQSCVHSVVGISDALKLDIDNHKYININPDGKPGTFRADGKTLMYMYKKGTYYFVVDREVIFDKYEEDPESGQLVAGRHLQCDTGVYSFCISHLHVYSKGDVVTKATPSCDGKIEGICSCGKTKILETIYYPKYISLDNSEYTYNGKSRKPAVTVKGSDGEIIEPSKYTVSYIGNGKDVGTHKVKIKFKKKYSGSVTKEFIIKPKATSILKLSRTSKGFNVKCKKQSGQITGYQVQYSANKKFSNSKTKMQAGNSVTVKIKGKPYKKYYVRVRTYKTVSGKKYYSSWSDVKKI